MKYFVFIFFLFLLSPISSANEIILEREAYSSFETLSAKIHLSVDLIHDLTINHFQILDMNNHSLSLPLYLGSLNDRDYYFSSNLASLPNGRYRLVLINARYLDKNVVKHFSLSKDFSLSNREEFLITVFPGFVFKEIESYELPSLSFTIKNKGNNAVNLSFGGSASFLNRSIDEITVRAGKEEVIQVLIKESPLQRLEGDFIAYYGNYSYHVPVTLVKKESIEEEAKNASSSGLFDDVLQFTIFEREIDIFLEGNASSDGELTFKNEGYTDLTDLRFFFDGEISEVAELEFESLDVLHAGEEKSIFVRVQGKEGKFGGYQGKLVIQSKEGAEARLPFTVTLSQKSVVNKNISLGTNQSVALDLSKEEKNSYLVWTLFAVLLSFIFLVIFILYKRSKKESEEFESFIDKVSKRR